MSKLNIGKDAWGRSLCCGDVCKYKIKDKSGEIKEYRGMIFYDENEYAFAFEQLEDNFPEILMNKVEPRSINKIINVCEMKESFDNYKEWKVLYSDYYNMKLII